MTTAGRPTWDVAKGSRGKWEGDLSAISKQYSVRDLPAHTKLKVRQEGQGRPEDVHGKDFKRVLEEKEKQLAQEKSGKGLSSITGPVVSDDKRSSVTGNTYGLSAGGDTLAPELSSSSHALKRPRPDAIAAVSTANLDADDPYDEDYEDENDDDDKGCGNAGPCISASGNRETDLNPDEDEDGDDDDEDEEDERMLLLELEKIKKERAEEASRFAAEKRAAEETIRMENILKGNPLLNAASAALEFKVKRRWDDDVVFKNCARGETDHSKRGFVNDTLRSEFHKKFMKKYIH